MSLTLISFIFVDYTAYTLYTYLCQNMYIPRKLQPYTGLTSRYVKNFEHFLKILQQHNISDNDTYFSQI